MTRNERGNRILAVVALLATLFVVLFSSFYISEHASHHCNDEEHCPVCAMIVQCERAVKTVGAGLILAFAMMYTISAAVNTINNYEYQSVQTTLVSQKVRLDS
jgi:hypothetical protein